MKTLLTCVCFLLTVIASAQKTVTQTRVLKAGEKLVLKFEHSKLIRISTWDKNEISVTAQASINNGQNDDSFILEEKSADGVVSVSDKILNIEKLPHRYTVFHDGKKTVFESKAEYEKFKGTITGQSMVSEGIDKDITIEVKVPAHSQSDITTTFALVELKNFNAGAKITTSFGGIDATLSPADIGKLQATAEFGEIYSNLDLKLTDKKQGDFFKSFTAQPGKGEDLILKSSHGTIYLRKR
jgi:hypothetical protein